MPLKRDQMIAEARKSIAELSPAKVKALLDCREIDLILDIREANEWAEAHIPGSVHAARGRLEWLADPSYENNMSELAGHWEKRIVVYCNGGGRALLAAQTLQRMGFSHVVSMAGGYRRWKETGLPSHPTDRLG
jgi:rhodanese-related sulfurtransferase